MKEAISSDQFDFAMFRPAAEQSLQDTRSRAFTDRYATRNTDDIGDFLAIGAQKLLQYSLPANVRTYIKIKQTRKWQINFRYFLQRDPR